MSQIGGLRVILEHENISKIDVNSIKSYKGAEEVSTERLASSIDLMKICQSIFLKRLSPEIANGMTNLLYAISHPNATDEDMENAVVKFDRISHRRKLKCNDYKTIQIFSELFI